MNDIIVWQLEKKKNLRKFKLKKKRFLRNICITKLFSSKTTSVSNTLVYIACFFSEFSIQEHHTPCLKWLDILLKTGCVTSFATASSLITYCSVTKLKKEIINKVSFFKLNIPPAPWFHASVLTFRCWRIDSGVM